MGEAGGNNEFYGRVGVKLVCEGSEETLKLIFLKRTASREDLVSEVQRRYGDAMITFEEDGDRIEVDTAEVVGHFLSSIPEGAKGKLFISKPSQAHNEVESLRAVIEEQKAVITTQNEKIARFESSSREPACEEPRSIPEQEVLYVMQLENKIRELQKNDARLRNQVRELQSEDEPQEDKTVSKEDFMPLEAELLRTFAVHETAVHCCAFSLRGDLLCAGGKSGFLTISNTETGKTLHKVNAHTGFLRSKKKGVLLSCDFAENGDFVATASNDRTARIWRVSDGSRRAILRKHSDKVYCCRFSPGGFKLATTSMDNTALIWDVHTGKLAHTLKQHSMSVFTCTFNTEGNILATGGDDRAVKLWDWRDNAATASLEGQVTTIWSVGFSQNGTQLITGSMGGEIKVWDLRKQEVLKSLMLEKGVHSAQFIRNDSQYVTCGRDNAISIRGTNDHSLHSYTVANNYGVQHADYHEGTDRLLTCSVDSTVKLWRLPLQRECSFVDE